MTAMTNDIPPPVEDHDTLGAQPIRAWSARLGIPYPTLLRAVRRGEIQAYRFSRNGHFWVSQGEIARYLKESMVVPTEASGESRSDPPLTP